MSGTFTGKSLADGQLAATKGTLYTTPAATVAYVRCINFYNTSASNTETIALYAKRSGGTSRQLAQITLTPKQSYQYDKPLALATGDLLEGSSTDATTVDYFISGAEET